MSEDIFDEFIEIEVSEEDKNKFKRLDQFLAIKIEGFSRSFIKNLFEQNQIVSKSKIELKKMPSIGTKITVQIPPPIPSEAKAENIPLDILYEDDYLVLINKPAGLVTHPAPGNYTGTLVNAILHHCPDIQGIGGVKRPGIVHRLDKGTSGIMVVAKEQKTHEKLVLLFQKHDIQRKYECLVQGVPELDNGKLESTIGRNPKNRLKMATHVNHGKHAITYYKVLQRFEKNSHLEMTLETGRTHQIRVHLTELMKMPILCDPTYANPTKQLQVVPEAVKNILESYPHPLLHAKTLGFIHPKTKKEINFTVQAPSIFREALLAF